MSSASAYLGIVAIDKSLTSTGAGYESMAVYCKFGVDLAHSGSETSACPGHEPGVLGHANHMTIVTATSQQNDL